MNANSRSVVVEKRAWPQTPAPTKLWLWGGVLLALSLRLVVLVLTSGSDYDLASYHLQAQSVFTHQNVYALTDRYPYPPVWVWLVALAQWAANIMGLPFVWLVKLPGILGDCLIVFLLGKSTVIPQAGLRAAMFYACNPVALLITAGHGQFDGLVLALVVAAWLVWQAQQPNQPMRGKQPMGREQLMGRKWWAALALGGAIALKGYPVIFLPVFVLRVASVRQQLLVLGLALAPLVASILLYGTFFGLAPGMVTHILGYSSYPYFGWGLYVDVALHDVSVGVFQAVVPILSLVARVAILLLLAFLLWKRPGWRVERLWLVTVLGIYVLAPGLAAQYFLWALPLLALVDLRRGLIFTALAAITLGFFYLAAEPGALPWEPSLASLALTGLWLGCYVLTSLPWWLFCFWLFIRLLLERETLPGWQNGQLTTGTGQIGLVAQTVVGQARAMAEGRSPAFPPDPAATSGEE